MKLLRIVLFAAVLAVTGSGTLWGQQVPQEEPLTRPRMGVGVQLTWPMYGVSGILDVGETLSAQAILGEFYGLSITGRGLYRLTPLELFTPFAYGAVGYSSGYALTGRAAAPHFGAGGGIEADVRRFIPDLPPIFVNLEVGVMIVRFPNSTSLYVPTGLGIHYRL